MLILAFSNVSMRVAGSNFTVPSTPGIVVRSLQLSSVISFPAIHIWYVVGVMVIGSFSSLPSLPIPPSYSSKSVSVG